MSSNIKRILIVHPFGIGDALFITPVIHALHQNGAEKIDLLLGSRTKELFESNPRVNEIFVLDRNYLKSVPLAEKFIELISLLSRLKQNHYDTFLDFSLSRQYAFFAAFFLWIPNRVGFNYKNRGIFLTQKLTIERGFSAKHVVEYYQDLLALI